MCCSRKISSPIRELELISLPICPYVHKSIVALCYKRVPFKLTHVDLKNKPDWFMKVSPLGKVPVLRVTLENGQVHHIFESSVISEFVDEVTPGRLHPDDPLERAHNKSFIEMVSTLYVDQFQMAGCSRSTECVTKRRDSLVKRLAAFEQHCKLPFWNGEKFSLVDCAMLPFFLRCELMNKYLHHGIGMDLYSKDEFPKLAQWSQNLLSLPLVKECAGPDFEDRFLEFLSQKDTVFSTLVQKYNSTYNVAGVPRPILEISKLHSQSPEPQSHSECC